MLSVITCLKIKLKAALREVRDLMTLYQLVRTPAVLWLWRGWAARRGAVVSRLHTPESSTVRDPRTLTTYAGMREEGVSHAWG